MEELAVGFIDGTGVLEVAVKRRDELGVRSDFGVNFGVVEPPELGLNNPGSFVGQARVGVTDLRVFIPEELRVTEDLVGELGDEELQRLGLAVVGFWVGDLGGLLGAIVGLGLEVPEGFDEVAYPGGGWGCRLGYGSG